MHIDLTLRAGTDIAGVNLVICHGFAHSIVSLLQAGGRAARSPEQVRVVVV